MAKAPERPVEPSDVERASLPSTTLHYLEYLEAAEQDALALVAAERNRCADCVVASDSLELATDGTTKILSRIYDDADDATAALERVKREARNEALRELAAWAKSEGMLFTRGKILALITEGQSDGE